MRKNSKTSSTNLHSSSSKPTSHLSTSKFPNEKIKETLDFAPDNYPSSHRKDPLNPPHSFNPNSRLDSSRDHSPQARHLRTRSINHSSSTSLKEFTLSRPAETFSANLLSHESLTPASPQNFLGKISPRNTSFENILREPGENPSENYFKNSLSKISQIHRSSRDRMRNKSYHVLPQVTPLDTGLAPSQSSANLLYKAPTANTTTTNTKVSAAYTKAMKALQERIRQLEEKAKDQEAKYQKDLSHIAMTERTQKDRLEYVEKQNRELLLKEKRAQEEKEELENKIIELETKVHRATSDRLLQEENDQEMEAEMKRLRRDLDEARKSEIMLQERLQNNITETAHEKDVLRSKNTVLTEALKRIEKDYTECKTMYNERQQDLITKNEQLEMEIEEMKKNYGQQMGEFEHELAEIEKSHTMKVEEYENTIAALNKRVAELEEFCDAKTKDVYVLKEKFEEYIKYMEQKQALGAQATSNGYFFGRNNNSRLDISDKISQSLLSPVNAFHNESDFLLTASKSPGHEFNLDLDTSKKMRSPDGLTSTERLLINSGRGLKNSPTGKLQISTEREKFESFRPKSASRSPLAQARERDLENYASGGSASKVGNRSIQGKKILL